jgi:RNA polymerase sigma-70 factor (ECF subfamily)
MVGERAMQEPALRVDERAPSDAELMAATREGDRDAFALLVDRYQDPLVGYLARLTGCRQRAEDLAQDAFLALYQHADRYVERGRLQGLLYRIATNRLRSQERRARRWRLLEPALVSRNGHGSEPARAPQRVLADEAQRELAAALAALPIAFRVPLVLHEIEGWPLAEVARWTGCREGTVKSRIHRGRRRLRERLAPYFEGGRS